MGKVSRNTAPRGLRRRGIPDLDNTHPGELIVNLSDGQLWMSSGDSLTLMSPTSPLNLPRGTVRTINEATTALSPADESSTLNFISGPHILTLPLSTDVNFPTNFVVFLRRDTVEQVYVDPDAGVTLEGVATANAVDAQYGVGELRYLGNDEWALTGDVDNQSEPTTVSPFTPNYGAYFDGAEAIEDLDLTATDTKEAFISFWLYFEADGTASSFIFSSDGNNGMRLDMDPFGGTDLRFRFRKDGGGDIDVQTVAIEGESGIAFADNWVHIMIGIDTTEAVAADGVKMTVNGVDVIDSISGYTQDVLLDWSGNTDFTMMRAIGLSGR